MKLLFTFLLAVLFSAAFAQQPKLQIRHITGNIYAYTTYSTYKNTITDANAVYLVTPKGVVVIDAPWDPSQFQSFLDSIRLKHHQRVALAIATHSHEDRAGGLAFFKSKGIKTYTSLRTDQILEAHKAPRAEFTFSKDTIFTLGGYKIGTYYAGAGHTTDNLVIWFGKDQVLFGGCLVKSVESKDLGYIAEADLNAWPKSINKLKEKYPDAKYVVTGHQAWKGQESLDYTLELLSEKEH